jgi:hypothetical protein
MSKVSLNVEIHFKKDGQEREPLYLNLTLNKESPSDDHIAQAVYDEVTQHLFENPWEAEEPQP